MVPAFSLEQLIMVLIYFFQGGEGGEGEIRHMLLMSWGSESVCHVKLDEMVQGEIV